MLSAWSDDDVIYCAYEYIKVRIKNVWGKAQLWQPLQYSPSVWEEDIVCCFI